MRSSIDGAQLAAGAGLLVPATIAAHLSLKELIDRFLDLRRAARAGERRGEAAHARYVRSRRR
jgi:hypothetical protein